MLSHSIPTVNPVAKYVNISFIYSAWPVIVIEPMTDNQYKALEREAPEEDVC